MKAVSELISFSILTLVIVISIALALYFVNPLIEKNTNRVAIEAAISSLEKLKNAIEKVISESIGSQRVVEIKIIKGTLYARDNIYFYLESNNLPFDDFVKQENNMKIVKNGTVFLINLTFTNFNISSSLVLSSGNYKICVRKNFENIINVTLC